MNPPMVKLVTSPRAQSNTSTTAMVHSMTCLLGSPRSLRDRALLHLHRRVGVLVDQGVESRLDVLANLAGALRDLPDQLVPVAFDAGQVVVREIAPRLLHAALQLLPL